MYIFHRLMELDAAQEETLTIICTFIDSTLLTASHEKKGVAMALGRSILFHTIDLFMNTKA